MCSIFVYSWLLSRRPVHSCPKSYFTKKATQLSKAFVFISSIKWRRVRDLNSRKIVIPWRISNTQSHEETYQMCAINVLCFLDYWFYKLVEYGFRKGEGYFYLGNTNIILYESGNIGRTGINDILCTLVFIS